MSQTKDCTEKNDLLNTCTKEQSFHLGVGDIYKIVIATQWILPEWLHIQVIWGVL